MKIRFIHLLTFLSTCACAFAYPFDETISDLPEFYNVTGIETRTDGTVATYNIPIKKWPDQIIFSKIRGGDGGRAKAIATAGIDQPAEGGGGALIAASFAIDLTESNALRPGGQLRFIIGSKGKDKNRTEAAACGGGGGTAVLYKPPVEGADWEILAVAGGGGGGAAASRTNSTFAHDGRDASRTTSGTKGSAEGYSGDSEYAGGTDGSAGISCQYNGGGGSYAFDATAADGTLYGSGGRKAGDTGGAGGEKNISNDYGEEGGFGFGGGGAGSVPLPTFTGRGGGGGGYSGGGAGGRDYIYDGGSGGGGGSYLDSRAYDATISERDSSKLCGSIAHNAEPNTANISIPSPTMDVSDPITRTSDIPYADPGTSAYDFYGNALTVTTTIPSGLRNTEVGTHIVHYEATDQFGNTVTGTRSVTLILPTPPTFSISGDVSADEDSGSYTQTNFVYDFDANDEGQTIDAYLTSNDNNALFSQQPAINNSGKLTFTPAANAHGTATVTVIARDSSSDDDHNLSDPQSFTITVNNLPDPPNNLTLNNASVDEAQQSIGTVSATEPFGQGIVYSLTGGADLIHFTIDSASGQLAMLNPQDFENPADANQDNLYEVDITATGSDGSSTLSVSIAVNDLSEKPINFVLSSNSIPENETSVGFASATDQFGGDVTYLITGGWDKRFFSIDANTGELFFLNAPDYETPLDHGNDNKYRIDIRATGSQGQQTTTFDINVTDANDAPAAPVIDNPTVAENSKLIGTLSSTDQDGDTVSFSIGGGADASRFSINSSTGTLSFKQNQNFENPSDADDDGIYEVSVVANDGTLDSAPATLSIALLDVNEPPIDPGILAIFTDENQTRVRELDIEDPEGAPVTYTISGGIDAALFTLDATSGLLEFLTPPNFENPHDSNANNGYLIDVIASDGELSVEVSVYIEVRDSPEAPTDILLDGQNVDSVTLAEDATPGTIIAELSAQDEDASNNYTWELSNDADGLFTLDGVLLKVADGAVFDFESLDRYTIEITLTDQHGGPITQTFTVQLSDVTEPAIEEFRSKYGLAADGSDDDSDWSENRVANIFYYLFGLGDPNEADIDRTLMPSLTTSGDNVVFSYRCPFPFDTLFAQAITSTDLVTWRRLDQLFGDEAPSNVSTAMEADGYLRYTLTIPTNGSARYFSVRPATTTFVE